MTRPLRSVLIGDVDFYPSEFAFGVNQALTRAGHAHTSVNIRHTLTTIAKRVEEMQPDLIWGHMLLWAPPGEGEPTEVRRGMTWKTAGLLDLCHTWRAKGAKVLIHDGDARLETRCPTDVSDAIDLALCNHTADRSVWKIPQLHWPYFAFDQAQIADPVPEFTCDLAFAGRLSTEGIYADRTELVLTLKTKLGDRMKLFPGNGIAHTLYRTPELAASADAILGYGRPDRNGWLDVRTFQYPGAGGVLLSDDVGGFLTPEIHYLPYDGTGGLADRVDAILTLLDYSKPEDRGPLRADAFAHVQAHHSATARVRQALTAVGLTL
jgi:hypothetical protein